MINNQESTHATPAHVRAMDLPVFKRNVQRSGMSPESFVQAITQTSLSSVVTWSQMDLETLLLAAERHGLDPLGREMYLLREGENYEEPALVVLGVDGWSRILNRHKKFAGMQFRESEELVDGVPRWIECTLHRWDRRVGTTVREYFDEVRGSSTPWLTHPRRMLRHKALVQCARLAFGLVGIYDQDEAQRIASNRKERNAPQTASQGHEPKPLKRAFGVEAVKAHMSLRTRARA
jgi:phage recombination protein Bet